MIRSMSERIREKLQILADAAKYDVSCSSSGSNRKIRIKDSEIPVPGSVIAILKTVVVSLCLKSYFQIFVFTTVLTVFQDDQMM